MRKAIFSALVAAVLPFVAQAQLHAAATKQDVLISGATPTGKVAICRIASQRIDGAEVLSRQDSIIDADEKGAGRFAADIAAHQAIWLVVDLATGDYVLATPPGYAARAMAPPAINRPGLAAFEWSRPSMDVWIVKKGAGIWHGEAGDGTPADDDRTANGVATFNLRALQTKANVPAPPLVLAPGDVVFVADPTWMVYAIAVVPKGAGGAN